MEPNIRGEGTNARNEKVGTTAQHSLAMVDYSRVASHLEHCVVGSSSEKLLDFIRDQGVLGRGFGARTADQHSWDRQLSPQHLVFRAELEHILADRPEADDSKPERALGVASCTW